jgi:hypothetical protein
MSSETPSVSISHRRGIRVRHYESSPSVWALASRLVVMEAVHMRLCVVEYRQAYIAWFVSFRVQLQHGSYCDILGEDLEAPTVRRVGELLRLGAVGDHAIVLMLENVIAGVSMNRVIHQLVEILLEVVPSFGAQFTVLGDVRRKTAGLVKA